MGRVLAAIMLISALAGCATVARVSGYPTMADAKNLNSALVMTISVHPEDDTLLISPETRLSGPIVNPPAPGEFIVRQTATEFFGETGCTAGVIRKMTAPFWEADFSCPPAFDVRAAVRAQREALRQGAPLRP